MNLHDISVVVPNTASTQTVTLTASTSAQTAAMTRSFALVTCTSLTFVIFGANPTATTSCMPLVPGVHYRLSGWYAGDKLAFISAAAGSVYVTPGA